MISGICQRNRSLKPIMISPHKRVMLPKKDRSRKRRLKIGRREGDTKRNVTDDCVGRGTKKNNETQHPDAEQKKRQKVGHRLSGSPPLPPTKYQVQDKNENQTVSAYFNEGMNFPSSKVRLDSRF